MTSALQRAEHLWQKRHTPEAKQLIRYTAVSAISTVVSFVVLAIVFGALHLWGEVVSTTVANVAGTIPSYFLMRQWVWEKGGRSEIMREIAPFWIMSALAIAVSIVGASLARRVGTTHHLSHGEQTVLVLAANLISFGVFWVLKYLLYNRLFHVHPVEELDELVEAARPVAIPLAVPSFDLDQMQRQPRTAGHHFAGMADERRGDRARFDDRITPPVGPDPLR